MATLIGLNGCMTSTALHRAKGQKTYLPGMDVEMDHSFQADGKPHPGYYYLLPLTVPADVATAPIQAVCFGGAYIYFSNLGQ